MESKEVGGVAPIDRLLVAEKIEALGADLSHVVASMEQRHGGKFHRTTINNGKTVRVLFELDSGDRIAADAPTTVEAVEKLRTKLETLTSAQG